MPIHPLKGEELELIRVEGNRGSKGRYVVALTQSGRRIRIPESWTDRCVSVGPQQIGGKQAKLALGGLQRLAEKVEDLDFGQKLDSCCAVPKIEERPEHKSSKHDIDTSKPVADAVQGEAGRSARRSGHAGAQNRSSPRGRRRKRGQK